MAVVMYWRERLQSGNPIRLEALQGVNYKRPQDINPEDPWPKAVSKQALLQDYMAWFDEVYIKPFLDTPFYQDCPEQLPKAATELEFFTTMSPFIHLVGRDQQIRSYPVHEQRFFEEKWVTVKVRRNFVRLCNLKEHVASFELQTGNSINEGAPARSDVERAEIVADAVKTTVDKIAANKAAMPLEMKKPSGMVEDA